MVSASDVVLIAGNSPHRNQPQPHSQSQVPIPISIPIPRARTRVTASSNAREKKKQHDILSIDLFEFPLITDKGAKKEGRERERQSSSFSGFDNENMKSMREVSPPNKMRYTQYLLDNTPLLPALPPLLSLSNHLSCSHSYSQASSLLPPPNNVDSRVVVARYRDLDCDDDSR